LAIAINETQMQKNYLCTVILFLLLSIVPESVKACQGAALQNYFVSIGPNGITINANSSPAVCGCGPYWMETEIICFSSGNFSGTPPVWTSSAWNIYPWYHSLLNNCIPPLWNDNCVLEPYSATYIPFTDLCPGAMYMLRSRELAAGAGGGPGPWTAATIITTPGIPVNPSFSVLSSSASDTICLGQSLTVSASVSSANTCGSTGSPLYSWSASPAQPGLPATGSSVTFTPTVSCMVSVSVAGGPFTCYPAAPQTFSVTVIQPPNSGTASASLNSVCADSCFTLSVSSFANGNLQWQSSPDLLTWTNLPGLTANPAQYCNLSSGLYFRALIDGVCTDTTSNSVFVASLPVPAVSAAASPTAICSGQSTQLTASGASAYVWNGGTLLNASGAVQTVQPAATTSYIVIGDPQAVCPAADTITVIVHQLPQVQFQPPLPVRCLGDTLLLSCGADTNTYSWSSLSGLISLNPSVNDSMLCTPGQSITYTVTAVSPSGCAASDSIFVEVAPTPSITASTDTLLLCLTAYDTVTFAGAAVYTISPLAGVNYLDAAGSIMEFYGSVPQVFFVTGTDTNGCSTTVPLVADTLGNPTVTASTGFTICRGDQLVISASGAAAFSWSGSSIISGANSAAALVAPDSTAFFVVTGSNANGCTATDTALVVVNQLPVVSFSLQAPDTLCATDGPIVLNGNQPPGGYFSGTGVFGNTFYPSISGSGVFPLLYSYTAANGCAASASDTVEVLVCSGIGDAQFSSGVFVFPNPVTTAFTVYAELKSDCFAEVFDAEGKLLLRRELQHGLAEFDCSTWPAGNYYITISSTSGHQIFKVVRL
jgi:Secretion system C-terminal sorting domain